MCYVDKLHSLNIQRVIVWPGILIHSKNETVVKEMNVNLNLINLEILKFWETSYPLML